MGIDELEVGEDYEIVVTNLSGFYRYRLQDVVRVTGYYNETPMIKFLYRKNQLLSIAGEKTNEEALRWAVDNFSGQTGLDISDYSIYADPDATPSRYTALMEPARIVEADELPRFRALMEQLLMQANPIYGDLVRNGSLGELELVFVQQQTYRLYRDMMIMKGASPNHLKPVRVIDTEFKKRFFLGLRELG